MSLDRRRTAHLVLLLGLVRVASGWSLQRSRTRMSALMAGGGVGHEEDMTVTEEQRHQIIAALGSLPPNLVGVAACFDGAPAVLRTYPLGGGARRRRAKAEADLTPFPTLFWLCHPHVSAIEPPTQNNTHFGTF